MGLNRRENICTDFRVHGTFPLVGRISTMYGSRHNLSLSMIFCSRVQLHLSAGPAHGRRHGARGALPRRDAASSTVSCTVSCVRHPHFHCHLFMSSFLGLVGGGGMASDGSCVQDDTTSDFNRCPVFSRILIYAQVNLWNARARLLSNGHLLH